MKKPYVFNYSIRYEYTEENKSYNELNQVNTNKRPKPDTEIVTESLENTFVLKVEHPQKKPDTGPLTFTLENDYIMSRIEKPDTEIETRSLEKTEVNIVW